MTLLSNRKLYPNIQQITFVGHSGGAQIVQRFAVVSPTVDSLLKTSVRNPVTKVRQRPDVLFIVANPSSYAYLDNRRYPYTCGTCDCTEDDCTCTASCTNPGTTPERRRLQQQQQQRELQFSTAGTSSRTLTSSSSAAQSFRATGPDFPCTDTGFNDWPYGIPTRSDPLLYTNTVPYAIKAVKSFAPADVYYTRNVFYLIGQNDTWYV